MPVAGPHAAETAGQLAAAAPHWSAALRATVAAHARRVTVPAGATLFSPGDSCQGFVIVLSGQVRVEHTAPEGRSLVLYRVGPGETCVVTTACLMQNGTYEAWGLAEGPVTALLLSPGLFSGLMRDSGEFRAMALGVFGDRLAELVAVIDDLLLHRVDLRLAAWLARRGPTLKTTHQAMALELGSAREVISRILKDFEHRGWVALSRGTVTVTDAAALIRFAAQRDTG
jgi:CRP/FNR family transcriptional regulator